MVSEGVGFILFIIVAVIICAVFAAVVIRSLKGKGCKCGCGKTENSGACCCMEHCNCGKK